MIILGDILWKPCIQIPEYMDYAYEDRGVYFFKWPAEIFVVFCQS